MLSINNYLIYKCFIPKIFKKNLATLYILVLYFYQKLLPLGQRPVCGC